MYDTNQALNQQAGSYGGTASTTQGQEAQPLTVDVMQRTKRALDQANTINGRLFELRNRLFSQPPTNNGLGSPPAPSPNAFNEAYREAAIDLQNMLDSIDMLSSEIANRL